MAENLWTILVSGGVGVLLGGFVQIAVGRYAAFKEGKGIAAAIRAEIEAITRLLEHRKYLDSLQRAIKSLENPSHKPTPDDIFTFRISERPFQVFDALCHKIGLLGGLSEQVVTVYILGKSLLVDITSLGELRKETFAGRLTVTREGLLDFTKRIYELFAEVVTSGNRTVSALAAYEQRRWLWFFS